MHFSNKINPFSESDQQFKKEMEVGMDSRKGSKKCLVFTDNQIDIDYPLF